MAGARTGGLAVTIHISEVRQDELDAAVAFAQQAGAKVDAAQVRACLSLVARSGEEMIGAVLCNVHAGDGAVLDLVLGNTDDGPAAGRQLVDKVLLKIKAQGMHTCRIHTHGGGGAASIWADANWLGKVAPTPEAA